MAEIEEELSKTILTDNLILKTSPGGDSLTIKNVDFTAAEAATLAWLNNHASGTPLKLEISLAE